MKPTNYVIAIALGVSPPIAAKADVWTFETPSENVQCSVGQESGYSDIQCTIIERNGDVAVPRPSSCNADWGHTFFMRDTGPAEVLCLETDTNRDAFDRAEYGVTGEFGGFTCHSSRQGFECTNRDGNGFFLSRASQSIIQDSAQDQAYSRAVPPSGELTTQMVQTALSTLGFDVGEIDGVMGPATRSAIEAWQRSNNWPVNGVLSLDQSVLLTAQFREAYAELDTVDRRWAEEEASVIEAETSPQVDEAEDQSASLAENINASRVLDGIQSVYHAIENCPYERGIATISYSGSGRAFKELTDICVDREGGRIFGSEPIEGFESVMVEGNARNGHISSRYEVIESGIEYFMRHSFTISDIFEVNGDYQAPSTIGFIFNHSHISVQHPGMTMSGGGFLVQEIFGVDSAAGPFEVSASITPFLPRVGIDRGVCQLPAPSYASGEPDNVVLTSIVDLTSDEATEFQMSESNPGQGTGVFQLNLNSKGVVGGFGRVVFENPRIAGYGPCEWVSAELEIDRIVGLTNGSQGLEFRAQGLGRGTYTDVNGDTFEILATANLIGFADAD